MVLESQRQILDQVTGGNFPRGFCRGLVFRFGGSGRGRSWGMAYTPEIKESPFENHYFQVPCKISGV